MIVKTPLEGVLLLIVVIGVVALVFREAPSPQASQPSPQPIVVVAPTSSGRGGDDRYTRAPRPQRVWNAEPEYPVRGALDPIPTRGAPESYQQMGVITAADGKLLPLYGRRVAARSDYFNYYTRTDTYNPVQLPITFKRRDCQDNAGCQELMNGDEVRLRPTGEPGKVMLYGFDGPRYNPDV